MFWGITKDIRYSQRALLKRPGFTIITTLTLALGIGASATMFSVINSIWFQPLPFPSPDRLIAITSQNLNPETWTGTVSQGSGSVAPRDFIEWRTRRHSWEDLAAYRPWRFVLTQEVFPETLDSVLVTPNFLPLLGIRADLGRVFLPGEDQLGQNRVVVISHNFWRRYYGANPEVIGRKLVLNGDPHEIVGVLPRRMHSLLGRELDLCSPVVFDSPELGGGAATLRVIGRLKWNVTLEQARSEMESIAGQLALEFPDTNAELGVRLQSLHERLFGATASRLWILFAAVFFVLAISCTCVAVLQLVRAEDRRKEMAVRMALGGGRARLIRQLLVESLFLALLGGLLGLLLAFWGVELVRGLLPSFFPRVDEIRVESWTLIFTLAVSILTGVLFGIVPALRASHVQPNRDLKGIGLVETPGPRRHRVRNILLVGQIALAIILLSGAGLMLRSLAFLLTVPLGFDEERLFEVSFSGTPQSGAPPRGTVVGALRSFPGMESVAVGSVLSGGARTTFRFQGEPRAEDPGIGYRSIEPGYFRTLRVPVLRGRVFDESETGVAVINETMAHRFWPGSDPLGQRILVREFENDAAIHEIVGVVGNVRYSVTSNPGPLVYVPLGEDSFYRLVFRTRVEPSFEWLESLSERIREVAPQNLARIEPVQTRGLRLERPKFLAFLFGAFGFLALALTSVGLFGVMSYSFARRIQEIGIRMALGAKRGNIITLALREGIGLLAGGVVLGIAGAAALSHLVSTLIHGVHPNDPVTLALATLLLAAVHLLSCCIPAVKAASLDPLCILKQV